MGFLRADIEVAMQAMQSNETDVVMEYLLNNPRGEEFQSSLPEGEGGSDAATGGAVDAAGDVPPQDLTILSGEDERVGCGDELNAPVTASLAASIGDVSVIENDDGMPVQDFIGSTTEPSVNASVQAGQSVEGAVAVGGGRGAVDAVGAAAEQPRSATARPTTTATATATTNGPADVLLLRRDLGQLITELSRLCEEDGTPRPLDPSSAPTLASAPTTASDAVPTLDSTSPPPITTPTLESVPVPQGNEAPSVPAPTTPIPAMSPALSSVISTANAQMTHADSVISNANARIITANAQITTANAQMTRARESMSDAQLMLQTLGRQGLQDSDPGSASWLSPAPRGGDPRGPDDSLVRLKIKHMLCSCVMQIFPYPMLHTNECLIVMVIVIVIGQDIVCMSYILNVIISTIIVYLSKFVTFLHYALQAFHTAGMWEQYRDDAFAERGVEPRPPILTGATIAGEIHFFLHSLPLAFILFSFISFVMRMHDVCTRVLCSI